MYKLRYSNELYHHGIKGQKWGVRRYQNPDGTLTAEGKKRYLNPDGTLNKAGRRFMANNYNYKNSKRYKTGNSQIKSRMTNQYNNNYKLYGKKAANRIEYKVANEHAKRSKETNKEFGKALIKGAAIAAGVYIITETDLAEKFAKNYLKNVGYANVTTAAADSYGKMKGLNTVKGGFTTGFKNVAAGKEFCKRLLRR